ncbi:tRNA-uridine aminocarboxypropyltransferase [Micromonospora sp. CPCC 205539]|uniref:tRNA-uridine aminocarboxypropyltransferase n=1 Tax=Micromonospora sp. CPCC 205539 TaxID=3122408 RepID=UPI002FF3ED90
MGRRPRCPDCGRPVAGCWCRYVSRVRTRHRLVVLRHPREARHAFGTVPVLVRTIPETEVYVGVRRPPAATRAIFGEPDRPPLLLYPAPTTAAGPPAAAPLSPVPGSADGAVGHRIVDGPGAGGEHGAAAAPRTLVVIDGTWGQARSMLGADPELGALPRLSLAPATSSRYAIRAQPFPHGLSTVEAVAEALILLGDDPVVRMALLRPLAALVGMHLACADAAGGDVLDDPAALERAGYLPPLPGHSPQTGL